MFQACEACECKLNNLDICINVKKISCCRGLFVLVRGMILDALTQLHLLDLPSFGLERFDTWVHVSLHAGRQFRCSVCYAKRSFYRATNAIFAKIGRFVSEEVLIELVRCKCMSVLLCGLECFFLSKSDVNSLYFAVRRFLIKIT